MAEETLSISMPPYASGTSTEEQPQFAGLADQFARQRKVLLLDAVAGGHDLVERKFLGGLRHLPVLVA